MNEGSQARGLKVGALVAFLLADAILFFANHAPVQSVFVYIMIGLLAGSLIGLFLAGFGFKECCMAHVGKIEDLVLPHHRLVLFLKWPLVAGFSAGYIFAALVAFMLFIFSHKLTCPRIRQLADGGFLYSGNMPVDRKYLFDRMTPVMQSREILQSNAAKKSYEISYALFRVAAVLSRNAFAEEMERRALTLLTAIAEESYRSARQTINALEHLIRLGGDVNVLDSRAAQILLRELKSLGILVSECETGRTNAGELNLEPMFTKIISTPHQAQPFRLPNNSQEPYHRVPSGMNGSIRQSAILGRIRQNGNLPDGQAGCKLKDIQDALPDVSERTIRYDLQTLLERGEIERMGNGGPATFYRIKLPIAASKEVPVFPIEAKRNF